MKIAVKTFCIILCSVVLAHADQGTGVKAPSGIAPLYLKNSTFDTKEIDYSLSGTKIQTGSQLGVCDNNPSVPVGNIFSLNMSIAKPIDVFTCLEMRHSLGARFTISSCKKSISCRQNIENSGADVRHAEKELNEIVAKDFIKNSMRMNGDDMERLEVLTKFAQKKYDPKLGVRCISRFKSEGKLRCDFDNLVESAFDEHQKSCSFGNGCYNLDNVDLKIDSYEKFKSNNAKKQGKYTREYFKYRTDKTVDVRMIEDEQRIKDLAVLAASSEFKKAKDQQKIKLIVQKIGRDSFGRLKDPILSYEFGNENPENPSNAAKFKDLISLMVSKAASKDVTKEFATAFESFRKKKAETILNGANICSKTNTFLQICNEATNISLGLTIKKDPLVLEHLSSNRTDKGIESVVLFDKLGTSFNEEDYDNLLNAKRCVAYGIVDERGNSIQPDVSLADSESRAGEYSAPSESRGEEEPDTGPILDARDRKAIADSAIPDSDIARSLTTSGTPEERLDSTPPTQPLEETGDNSANISGVNHSQPGQIPSTYSDMFSGPSNFDTFGSKEKKGTDEVVSDKGEVASGNAAMTSQDRMNEYLMKKLATAEENLAKLKADAETAEEDRIKQKKIDEEAALIKDLKGQIADLRIQADKNTAKKASEISSQSTAASKAISSNNSYSSNSGPSVISSRGDTPAVKTQSTAESFDAKYKPVAVAPQVNASPSRSSSGAILSSTTNSDGSRTTTLGSGLVVTTIDGLSSEKAQQTISNRILELNGTPFYIEEGGMVKEIIAVVKDGKVLLDEKGNPIFEKIVKGKVGDKKFAAKSKDKNDRTPAAITDAADLKRDQEEKLKRERAEYLKLKNLTSGALKKK